MGCEGAVIASSINGLLIGLVVGITLGIFKGLEYRERFMSDWLREMIPQCAVVGVVIGFSHSLLSNCTGILQNE